MPEPIIHLTLSQLSAFAHDAGRAGGEAALAYLTDRHAGVLALVERSGAHKSVLSTAEAALYAGVRPATIRRWIRDGMAATSLGGSAGHQIRKTDIDDWRTRPGTQPTGNA